MVKILIVENDPLAVRFFKMMLEENYEITHVLESAQQALNYCKNNPVDLILMDICTNFNSSGLEVSQQIKQIYPHIKIVIVTSQPECDYINRAKEAKVDSFWYKTSVDKELLEVIDKTLQGISIYPDETPQINIGYALSTDFTPRELDVLRELTTGDTNAEIAKRLGLSSITVRNHIQNMLEKTGYTSRTTLAVVAGKTGLVNKEY